MLIILIMLRDVGERLLKAAEGAELMRPLLGFTLETGFLEQKVLPCLPPYFRGWSTWNVRAAYPSRPNKRSSLPFWST